MLNGEMLLLLLLLAVNFDKFITCQQYEYDDEIDFHNPKKTRTPKQDLEFEPVVNLRGKEKQITRSSVNCEDFTKYAVNCTLKSALIYNSSKKSPPMPAKMLDWCTAIQHLTNCAIDWNSECKDATESHFNEESIKGHMHVVNNICDDEFFLARYDELPECIDRTATPWETCYAIFKATVDIHKNTTQEWTHYETHFQLCCARTRFRHCTLDALFLQETSKCSNEHAAILQKFSVIVSEGDVFQNCERNVMYANCPGGDPRPPTEVLLNLMNADAPPAIRNGTPRIKGGRIAVFLIGLLKLCL